MTRDEARRRAEEALARYDAVLTRPLSEWRWDRFGDCISALRALLAAEPEGKACGSISTVRSDDTPAAPLPTCANCGSNLIEPAPAPDAVAPETIIDTVRWVLNDAHYKAPEQIAGLWREVWAPKLRTAIDAMPVGAPAADAVAGDEIETARAMLGLTVRMAEAKHACRDTTCRNVLTAALNMLLALDARRRG